MRRMAVLLVLDAIVVAAIVVAFFELHPHRGVRTVRTGVVLVDANLGHGIRTEGTGVLLTSHGELLTNNHVIDGALSVHVFVPQTHRRYRARVLGYDVGGDTAVLQLDGAHGLHTVVPVLRPARLGQQVIAVGGSTGAIAYSIGNVTQVRARVTADDELGRSQKLQGLIEFDAEIEPGDSGGPLLDRDGHVIGLNTAGVTRADFFTGRKTHVSFAIPIAPALAVADAVVHGHAPARVHVGPTAYLGVVFGTGSTVAVVLPGSPAERAGIAAGARLAASPAALQALLLRKHPGDRIPLVWADAAGSHRAVVALGRGPAL